LGEKESERAGAHVSAAHTRRAIVCAFTPNKYEFALWHMMAMQKMDRFKPFLKLLETKERHQQQLALLRIVAKQQGWSYVPSM
jgi:hypothetical protein